MKLHWNGFTKAKASPAQQSGAQDDDDTPGLLLEKPQEKATKVNAKPILMGGGAVGVLVVGTALILSSADHKTAPNAKIDLAEQARDIGSHFAPPPLPKMKNKGTAATAATHSARTKTKTTTTVPVSTPPAQQPSPQPAKPSPQLVMAEAALSGSPLVSGQSGIGGAQTTAQAGKSGSSLSAMAEALRTAELASAAEKAGEPQKKKTLGQQERGAGVYDTHLVRRPASPYEIQAGSVIPATLVTGINSDLPGSITAVVSRDVFDSISGAYLEIPAGTRVVGTYTAGGKIGQNRVLVAWTRLIFPNGSYLNLGAMEGASGRGYSGFHDLTDDHTWEIFKDALLMTLLDVGIGMADPDGGSALQTPTASQSAEQAMAASFGQVETQMLQANMNIAPTQIIRPGYQFGIVVTKDLIFPSPYNPAPAALPATPGNYANAAVVNPYGN